MPSICYVIDTFPKLSETFILREVRTLQAQGIDIRILALNRSKENVVHEDVRLFEDQIFYSDEWLGLTRLSGTFVCCVLHPVRTILCLLIAAKAFLISPRLGFQQLKAISTAIYFLHCASRDIAHVHAHFVYVAADVAKMLGVLWKKPWSVSAHAWDIHVQGEDTVRFRLNGVDAIYVCSNAGLSALKEKAPELAERMVLMHHGIDLDRYEPAAERGINILAVGRLEAKKGFDVLVGACAELARRNFPFHCRVVGEGDEREGLLRQVKKARLENMFEIRDYMSQTLLLKEYEKASVFVMPSCVADTGDRDGIPNVILEAMAMGVPVIGTDVGGIPEAVIDGKSGIIVESRDEVALADAIERLSRQPELAEKLAAAGRQLVKEKFDLVRNVQPLLDYLWKEETGRRDE